MQTTLNVSPHPSKESIDYLIDEATSWLETIYLLKKDLFHDQTIIEDHIRKVLTLDESILHQNIIRFRHEVLPHLKQRVKYHILALRGSNNHLPKPDRAILKENHSVLENDIVKLGDQLDAFHSGSRAIRNKIC